MSPVGAGEPPSGSTVTAQASGETPGAVTDDSTYPTSPGRNTPADDGSVPLTVHSW